PAGTGAPAGSGSAASRCGGRSGRTANRPHTASGGSASTDRTPGSSATSRSVAVSARTISAMTAGAPARTRVAVSACACAARPVSRGPAAARAMRSSARASTGARPASPAAGSARVCVRTGIATPGSGVCAYSVDTRGRPAVASAASAAVHGRSVVTSAHRGPVAAGVAVAREAAARCRYAATGSPGSGPRASLITPGLRGRSVRSAVRITTSARTITTPTPSVVTAPRRTVRSLTGGLTSRRPQGVQRVLQVLGVRAGEIDPGARAGMLEAQADRVQPLPLQSRAGGQDRVGPVGEVPGAGMVQGGEVHADLVRPPGLQLYLDERGSLVRLQRLVVGDRVLAVGGHGEPPVRRRVPTDRGVDGPGQRVG